jgi:hypothetical protein
MFLRPWEGSVDTPRTVMAEMTEIFLLVSPRQRNQYCTNSKEERQHSWNLDAIEVIHPSNLNLSSKLNHPPNFFYLSIKSIQTWQCLYNLKMQTNNPPTKQKRKEREIWDKREKKKKNKEMPPEIDRMTWPQGKTKSNTCHAYLYLSTRQLRLIVLLFHLWLQR